MGPDDQCSLGTVVWPCAMCRPGVTFSLIAIAATLGFLEDVEPGAHCQLPDEVIIDFAITKIGCMYLDWLLFSICEAWGLKEDK